MINKETFPRLADERVEAGPKAWLGRVIDELCEHDNYRLGFAEGFFEEEIAEVIWSNSQTTREFDFELKRQPLPAAELYRFTGDTKQFTDLLDQPQRDLSQSVKLLVFDLCYRKQVEQHCGSEWKVVEYPHDKTVPVGIGFSLSFLPRLLAHDNWRKLRKMALDKLSGQCSAFAGNGFELEQEDWNLPTRK